MPPITGNVAEDLRSALAWLEGHGSRSGREAMARYGVSSAKAFGVSMANIQVLGKRLGRNHDLAAALWATDRYEARMLTAFVDEPERVTGAQMDRWCRDFDNWAIVDTICFHLFDRTAAAWSNAKFGATEMTPPTSPSLRAISRIHRPGLRTNAAGVMNVT